MSVDFKETSSVILNKLYDDSEAAERLSQYVIGRILAVCEEIGEAEAQQQDTSELYKRKGHLLQDFHTYFDQAINLGIKHAKACALRKNREEERFMSEFGPKEKEEN